MAGILPTGANGGLVVRDEFGVCTIPATVVNAYCPQPEFTTSCEVTYLPDGCTARITPAQINAFESELLCFAEKLNPDGNWNCTDLCNLSTNFQSWLRNDYEGSFLDALEDHSCARPVITAFDDFPAATYMLCDGAGNLVRARQGQVAGDVVDHVCADAPTGIRDQLVDCLISGESGNVLVKAADGKMFVPSAGSETLTSLVREADGDLVYTDEAGTANTIPCFSGVDVICANGAITIETCEGETITFQPQIQEFFNEVNAFAWQINATTPLGTIAGSTQTLTFNLDAPCPQSMQLTFGFGSVLQTPPATPPSVAEYARLVTQISYDGGTTWNPFRDPGNTWTAVALYVDLEYFRRATTPAFVPGPVTIMVRHVLQVNALAGASVITSSNSTLTATRVVLACCP